VGGVRSSLALALAGVLVLASCGDTSTTSTVTSPSGTASTAATGSSRTAPAHGTASTAATGTSRTAPAPGTASTAATGSTRTAPAPARKAGREQTATACARAIEKASRIAPSAKPHLVQVCEKAASPDQATRRQAAREACVELVTASQIPAGPSRKRALAICNAP